MILVTGATGFLGIHLIRALDKRGEKARCLVRRDSDISKLKKYKVELTYGDLEDGESLKEAVKGIRTVIHLASAIRAPEPALYRRINVIGTQNLLDACVNRGVERFIFISSDEAIFSNKGPYGQSKFEAEELIKKSPINFTILRPTVIYGRGDTKGIGTLISFLKKYPIIPIFGNGEYLAQPTYLDDVVLAITNVMDSKASINKTYNIAGLNPITFNELIDTILEELKLRRLKVHLPLPAVRPLIKIYEKVVSNPTVTSQQVISLTRGVSFDIQPAADDFGYHPCAFQEGIRKMLKGKA